MDWHDVILHKHLFRIDFPFTSKTYSVYCMHIYFWRYNKQPGSWSDGKLLVSWSGSRLIAVCHYNAPSVLIEHKNLLWIWFEFLRPFYDNWGLMDFSVAYSAQNKESNPGAKQSVLLKDIAERKWPTPPGSNQGPSSPKAGALTTRPPMFSSLAFNYLQFQ